MTPKCLLFAASIGEAITWTILLAGMLLKYGFGTTDWLVTVGGSLHGAMFLSYLFCGLLVGVNQRFGWGALVLGGLAAIPPFATLLYDWWASRKGLLEGGWRRIDVAHGDSTDVELDEVPLDTHHERELRKAALEARDASGEFADASAPDAPGHAPAPVTTAGVGSGDATATATATAAPALPAHPADRRVAARGERPAKLQWLDPLVRWSVAHPYTLICTAIMVCALIFTGAATGQLTAPYKDE